MSYLLIETVIKHRQNDYYRLLGEADQQSDFTSFIGFLLQAIQESLEEAINEPEKMRVETQVKTRVEIPAKTPDQILSLLKTQPELTIAEVA